MKSLVTTRRNLILLLAMSSLTLIYSCDEKPPESPCDGTKVTFEDLSVGTSYVLGDVFTSDGVSFTVSEFILGNGNPATGGNIRVHDQQNSGGSGNDLWISNVTIKVDVPADATKVTFNAATYGGNMNLKVNGDFKNFNAIADINGTTLGGVAITATGPYNTPGIWTLDGSITSLEVGGQEFWVDNICINSEVVPDPVCDVLVQFEDLTYGTSYVLGDLFTSYGVAFTVGQFIWSNNNPATGGNVRVDNQQLSGGSGNDLCINNVTIEVDVSVGATKVTFNAATYGGNMNLKVNGDFKNFNAIADINVTTIGG